MQNIVSKNCTTDCEEYFGVKLLIRYVVWVLNQCGYVASGLLHLYVLNPGSLLLCAKCTRAFVDT